MGVSGGGALCGGACAWAFCVVSPCDENLRNLKMPVLIKTLCGVCASIAKM